MRMIKTILAGGAGLAALAAAAPAAAQYGYANPYGYSTPYSGYGYGYNNYAYGAGVNSTAAVQQCSAAVQNRLYNRTSVGQILGSLVGLPTTMQGRVLQVTSAQQTSRGLRIRGLASSGRTAYNNYSPYGVGAYGALGYNYAAAADLSFKCDVDYRGFVRDLDINRRY
jgi:hypothetical protein